MLHTSDLLRKWQFPLLIGTAVAPIPAVIFAFLAPKQLLLAWLFPVAYLLLYLPAPLIPGKLRRIYGIIMAAVILLAGLGIVLPLSRHFTMLSVPALYGILLFFTIPTASYSLVEEPPGYLLWIGMLFHTIQFILLQYSRVNSDISPVLASAGMFITFAVFFLTALLSRNRSALSSAATGKPAIPPAMQKKNRLLLFLFAGGVLALSMIPAASTLVYRLLLWLLKLIWEIMVILTPVGGSSTVTMPTEETEVPEDPSDMLIPADPPPIIAKMEPVLAVLFRVLIIAAIVAGFIVLIVLLVRLAKRLLRWSVSAASYYHTASAEDYVDEITDTRESGDTGTVAQKKTRDSAFVDIRKLPPREQIRLRYRRLLKKHPQWQSSSTARENLAQSGSGLYERARYSDQEISPSEAEQFHSQTKRL